MAKKNNLKPKPYAKNNIERWKHLNGHELEEFTTKYYTRDQIRAIAARYGIKNYSRRTADELVNIIKQTDDWKKAGKTVKRTLFEVIRDNTKGQKKPVSWYTKELKKLTRNMSRPSRRMTIDEKYDSVQNIVNQDSNELRRYPIKGHMYFYDYNAISKVPYFDKFPLTYILQTSGTYFYGANFHYMSYNKRKIAIENLQNGVLDIPKHIVHKYLLKECKSLFLDLGHAEWVGAAMLPVEQFVLNKGNRPDYDKELVWEETKRNSSRRLKGSLIRV